MWDRTQPLPINNFVKFPNALCLGENAAICDTECRDGSKIGIRHSCRLWSNRLYQADNNVGAPAGVLAWRDLLRHENDGVEDPLATKNVLHQIYEKSNNQNKLSIPGFFGACNDPVELGILKNAGAPEGNCSGVTYAIPYAIQFEILTKVLPQMKSVLLLVQDGHPTSILNQQGTKTACESLKIQYNDKACKTKEDAIAAAKEVESKGVVVILGSQALLIDNGGAIAMAVKCPVISYTEKPVMDGALCGLVADDVKLGGMLAESVVNVLLKGTSIHQTPVKVDSQPQLLINTDTAERIGLAIPFEILESAKRIQK